MSSSHPGHPVCPICNYDLRGLTQTDDRRLTCTECGTQLQPASPQTRFTKKKLHRLFFQMLVVPTTSPALLGILLSPVPAVALYYAFFCVLIALFLLPTLCIISTSIAYKRAKPYPRPYNRWVIVLFGLLYTLPAIGCTILMYSAALYFFTV